jgi:3-hydroxyisobutyrate dehydrogenase
MPKVVDALVLGAGGILENARKGTVYFDLSTNSPTVAKRIHERMAEKGIIMLDAPVSGGTSGAEAGTIAIMVGAPDDVYAKVAPVLQQISPNVFHAGGVGNGQTMKLVNNVIAASIRQITFEAIAMGVKNGLSLETCIQVLNKSSGKSYTSELMLPRLADGSL